MTSRRLAIPTEGEGGLDGARSGSFGRCACYTCVDIENGEVRAVSILANDPHHEDSEPRCQAQVRLLTEAGVTDLVAAGIGVRPFRAFRRAGLRLYYEPFHRDARPVLEAFLAGRLPEMREQQVCEGMGNCLSTRPAIL